MKHFSVYWVTCVVVMAMMAGGASATTIVMPADTQLVAKSPLIIEGTVVSSTPVDRNGSIWTESTIRVERVLKGTAPAEITVREIGGIVGDRITKIFGAPEYAAGERVMAFLTQTPRGDYQTMDLFVGKFTEETMANGERLWARHDEAAAVSLLDSDFRPIGARNVQRRAEAFESFVISSVAGVKAMQNYGVENPVLERDLKPRSGAAIVDNFTLIDEPNVYRWFTFEQGGSARWYSYGTQSGYSGGGVNEIQSALGVWNNYGSAKISYVYAGAGSGTPAGLSRPNGVNEILFNDPLNEISGSFNPQTGGTVGQGGFNGVTNGGNWTAPFTADGSHTATTYRTWNITEGNLTIQDNVTPSTNVSSGVLAEIVAHEFGHTLGFGHSSDSSALMYATISPGGASLRTDDQTAARWLYPNGSQQPPVTTVPSAPSNLNGSATSSSTIALQWIDNATNESGDYIYLAAGSGSFSRVGQVAAGATTTVLSGLSAGTYRVYLTAFNSAGESAASNTVNVTLTAASSISAAFALSPSTGTAGATVFTFTDQSSGSYSSRSWNFGDGSTGSAATATHVYANAGTYTIVLTIANATQSSQASRTITVNAPIPSLPSVSAFFEYTPATPRAGDSVGFSDTSSGSPTSWSWSFGDGATSTAKNPSHTFAAAGTYNVTLTATNGGSASSATRQVTVVSAGGTYRSLIPASAQTNGASGSVWRTELTIFNAGDDGFSVQIIFIPSAGGSMQTRTIFLSPKETVTYGNALLDVFGMSSGAGALAIEASSGFSTPNLKVSSRTFTTGSSGTYGQAVPSVDGSDMQPSLMITGMEVDADYRTNIGLVNRSASAVGATLTLFSGGSVIGSKDVTVPANNFSQTALTSYFPALSDGSFDRLTLSIQTPSSSALSAYASVVDNRTQDPVYIQARTTPQPAANELVIPAVGRAPGANGTFWRSDVTMFNSHGVPFDVTLRYGASARSYTLGAGETVVLRDVLASFGLTSGTGALRISWTAAGGGPAVTSRTYTTTESGGTYGQSIDPVQSFGYDSIVPGLRSDSSFRSNIGFVNGGDAPINIGVTLLNNWGQTVATASLTLQGRAQTQTSLSGLFPKIDTSNLGTFTLQAHTDNAATLFLYGSIVDNRSGDPVFFAGE